MEIDHLAGIPPGATDGRLNDGPAPLVPPPVATRPPTTTMSVPSHSSTAGTPLKHRAKGMLPSLEGRLGSSSSVDDSQLSVNSTSSLKRLAKSIMLSGMRENNSYDNLSNLSEGGCDSDSETSSIASANNRSIGRNFKFKPGSAVFSRHHLIAGQQQQHHHHHHHHHASHFSCPTGPSALVPVAPPRQAGGVCIDSSASPATAPPSLLPPLRSLPEHARDVALALWAIKTDLCALFLASDLLASLSSGASGPGASAVSGALQAFKGMAVMLECYFSACEGVLYPWIAKRAPVSPSFHSQHSDVVEACKQCIAGLEAATVSASSSSSSSSSSASSSASFEPYGSDSSAPPQSPAAILRAACASVGGWLRDEGSWLLTTIDAHFTPSDYNASGDGVNSVKARYWRAWVDALAERNRRNRQPSSSVSSLSGSHTAATSPGSGPVSAASGLTLASVPEVPLTSNSNGGSDATVNALAGTSIGSAGFGSVGSAGRTLSGSSAEASLIGAGSSTTRARPRGLSASFTIINSLCGGAASSVAVAEQPGPAPAPPSFAHQPPQLLSSQHGSVASLFGVPPRGGAGAVPLSPPRAAVASDEAISTSASEVEEALSSLLPWLGQQFPPNGDDERKMVASVLDGLCRGADIDITRRYQSSWRAEWNARCHAPIQRLVQEALVCAAASGATEDGDDDGDDDGVRV